ncbi:hypothetical protein [Streptomyces niveus]|uniref:hypothetical protein n=1 Tax=Streptomyces niveus TaxID=193462 RepID=UPI00386F3FFB
MPILEIVTKPARGLVRGFADGRAERSEVLTAFNEVLSRLEHARPGARLAQIFPASAGYVVDYLAEDLPVRMNEAGGSTILVHHTATASVGHLVAFIQHVRGRMRQESEPVRLAHADAGVGFGFGAWAREDFIGWLSRRPEWDREANPWDSNDLEGALALGYTQVAATVRGGLNRAHRPKDFTAVASRDALAAIRKGLGAAPRAYLEHRAGRIAARFKDSFKDEIVVRGGGILDLPLTMSSGPLRATVGQYLDNLLLEKPERFVDQHESLGIRTHFHTLETNPDHRGVPRLDPPVVRMEVRAYASTRETPQTIADDSDTLALLSLSLYNQARLDRGLPPVGRPIAPAQHWPQYAPPTRPLPSSRPADSAMSAGPDPAEAPAPSSVPLAPALAETAARLIAMDAETRAQELASLAPWDREALAADPAFVEQLRMALSESDFRAVAGRLLVVVPEGVEQPVAARGEAEALVAGMLADPQVAVALLTGGRRMVVVPRDRPLTSLPEFAALHGRSTTDGRSLDGERGLYFAGHLVGVGEENLLGETTVVPDADLQADGYSAARHEWAHAIESVLSPEDRQWITDVYEEKKKAEAEARAKARAEVRAKAEAEARAQAQAQTEMKATAQTKVEAKARAQAKARARAEARAEARAQTEMKAAARTKVEAKAEAKARAQAEGKARAEVEAAVRSVVQWPDGPGANYSSSNAHEYFAQLTNVYLGANTGRDADTHGRRNNGSDWVEQHAPELLPLLHRLYGSGRPSHLATGDNSYALTGFRQLWEGAEQALPADRRAQPDTNPATSQTSRPEVSGAPSDPADVHLAPPARSARSQPAPRIMTESEFRQRTATSGRRGNSTIAQVDDALRAYHALPSNRQGARLLALKGIVEASLSYAAHKAGGGRRVEGAQDLARQAEEMMRQLNPESVFRDVLTVIDGILSEGKDPDLSSLSPGGEAQKASQALPAARFHAMMADYVQMLGGLRDDRTLPAETRVVIEELMAVAPLVTVMQYPHGGMPGVRLNPSAPGQRFTFNVDTQVRGGTSFLLGHISHELTHIAAHQAFGSSPVMELVRSGATDAEVGALAAERSRALSGLEAALAGNREFGEFQKRVLREKLGYGAQPQTLERYAHSFERAGKITSAQRDRLVSWGTAAGDASGTLVEYDTVLNQMLVYLHLWNISRDDPFYVQLRAAAQAAYARRAHARGLRQSSEPADVLMAPPATTASSVRPAGSTVPAGPASGPGPSPTPLPPALVETAAGLVAMDADADARAREPASLPQREHLAQPGLPKPAGSRPVPPATTSTAPEQSAPARLAAEPAPSTEPRPVPVRELPTTEERPASVQEPAPATGQPPLSQEEQLAERGLAPVYVMPGGDVLAQALTAVAPAESGRLARQSRPASPDELRTALADALTADLRRPSQEQRLWPSVAEQAGSTGAPLATAFSGTEAVRAVRTGSGPDATDWLTLAVAAPALGVRLTVLTPDGTPWTTGPEDGRPVTLFQQANPAPYTAPWAATEPTAQARQAQRPDLSQPVISSGFSWNTTSTGSPTRPGTTTTSPAAVESRTGSSPVGPAATTSSTPAVFFGSEPRPITPAPQRADTSSGTEVTRTQTPPAPAPAPVAVPETAVTVPPAEETTAPHAPTSAGAEPVTAATPEDDGTPRVLSRYAQTYGSRFDGSLGLVLFEPLSEDVLGALHQQVLDGLGVEPGSAAGRAVREELAAVLGQSEIARELPQMRSARGHRVTVTVDGRERTVDVRLRLTDPALSTRGGTVAEVPRRTNVERHGEGGQSSSRSAGSGTMRTVPIPWIGIYDGPAGPMRWFDGAMVLSLTHHQSSESSTVSDGLTARTMQRANDPAHAVQYTGNWQIRVDTDRNAPVDTWRTEQAGGPLTVWFPEHRVFGDGAAAGPLARPAGLDGLPLWGVDEVLDPGRLLDELRADDDFTVLNDLGADSHLELEEFLSERMLRGSLPMQRDGGVHSPVLFHRDGDSLGVLRLEATVVPRDPASATPDGKFSLESWLTQSSGVDQSSRVTSGVALDGSGGPTFTPDQAVGHPDAAELMGGSVMGKAGASWQSGDTLNTGSSVALMHALYTTNTHLVTPADITYRVTLIRSGGGEITGSFGPWPEAVSLRLPQRSTATGHVPTPEERRQLPEHLENLESVGLSAVPVTAEGTGRMFDRAEAWLRREGFLPPAERASVFNEDRAERQLENLRRFTQLRSRIGQAAAQPDAVDGGRPLWFDLPDHVNGGRRVQLRYSATRDRTRPAAHTRRLPGVDTVTFNAQEARGGRQRGNMFGGTVGGGAGPRFPIDGGAAALDATGDFTWGRSHDTSASAGSAVGMDGFNITTGAGTELFDIPALFTLDLYEGTAEEPAVRFAAEPTPEPVPEPVPGGNPAMIQPAEPAPPAVAGHVRLVVPHHRTVPADTLPVVPTAPYHVRAPITGGGQDDDRVRLGLTDDTGRPRAGLLRLPDDANVDVFRGSAALQEAFRQIVTGTYPGHPAVGTFGQWVEGATSQLPGAVTWLGSRLWGYLTGPAADDQRAFAGEALYQQLRGASLLGRASQIFNGGYVVEGLTLPGLLSDQELSLEITGYLHNPTYNGSYTTYAESNLSARDMSATGRSVTTSHQYGVGLGALQSPPPPSSDGTPQRASLANPSVRGVYTHRTGRTSELSAGSTVVRTPTEAGEQHLIGADATLLVTLRQGTRNVAMNVAGLGGRDGVTLAIDLPRAIRFQLSNSQLIRFERWFTGVPGLPRPIVAPNTVPLPELYVGTGEVGLGSVLSVTQLDNLIQRNEKRDRLRSELLALVEREAPGVTRPGHFAYRTGMATRIADLTSPAQLRALPGRRTVSQWVRHGSRLMEITLSAEPVAQTPARRELRGRPAGAGAGIDQIGAHAPGNRSESETVSRSLRVSANPISRYPRPQGRTGRTDRTGPVLSGTGSRGRTSRTDFAAEDRYWARNESVADFDNIDYTITATVRSVLVQDWPVDLVGGALESGLLTLTERNGGEPLARILRLLRGRPTHEARVPVAVSLRFASSESVAPRQYEPAVRPRITHADPRLPAPQAPLPLGGRPFTAGSRLLPTGATPVYAFNAFHELADALRTVAPRLSGSWGLTADLTPEAAAFRLGELVQAGEIPVEAPRTAVGLTDTMPGAWPLQGEPVTPRLQVTLHNPRPISDADDIAVDRLRVTSRSVGSSSSAASTAGLGYQWTQSGNDANTHLVSFTLPVLNRQPVSRTAGASASGGGWDRLKTGAAASSETEPATRSYETMVDVVITVAGEETRYVVGSAVARVYERDLLGYGVTAPRTASQVYDLPAMLAEQPNDALRNWRTHPVTELPAVLARGLDERENGAQLWLHVGADPDGTGLARALYVGSRTAVAAGRPVELVVRGETGLRFWPFGADGSLVDLTPATQETWNRLRTAIVAATDAATAEAEQVARGTQLMPREADAELRLADSRRELTVVTEARDGATAAHDTARAARDSLADRLGDAETERATAEARAAEYAAAVTTAEERLARTEQVFADARQEAERAAAQPVLATADGPEPTPQVGPNPGAALADARAELDRAHVALVRAEGMADVAQEAVDRAVAGVGDLRDQLATADDQVREAATREQGAADAVTRATSARDQHYRDHQQLQEELRDARRQQADQQRLWQDAWGAMPGQSGTLSADRCREGVGGARFPLGSLS